MFEEKKWGALLAQCQITIDGEQKSLAHLTSYNIELNIPETIVEKGKRGNRTTKINHAVDILIGVEFSSHCVSVGPPDDGPPFDFDELGHDKRIIDHRDIHRRFCHDRYRWSQGLKDVINKVVRENVKCYFAKYNNWMMVSVEDQDGVAVDYEIFFQVSRRSSNSLKMFIESAYVRYPGEDGTGLPSDRSSVVKFHVIATKKARGEPIKKPRK